MLAEPIQLQAELPKDTRHEGKKGRCLNDVIELLSGPGHPEEHGTQLAKAFATALDAHHCAITFLAGDQDGSKARIYANWSMPPGVAAELPGEGGFLTPIRCDGKVIGSLKARRGATQRSFSELDRELAKILTCFLGSSMQVFYLRNLLKSRFARISLAESGQAADVDAMLQSAVFPDRMVRLLARSFYREMRKAGLGPAQIIDAVSEIISQVTEKLKKQRKEALEAPAATSAEKLRGG